MTSSSGPPPTESKRFGKEPIMKNLMLAAWFTLALSTTSQAQDMQGFDPNAEPVPDFELTPFYETDLDFVGKKPGTILKVEEIPAPEGAEAWRVIVRVAHLGRAHCAGHGHNRCAEGSLFHTAAHS